MIRHFTLPGSQSRSVLKGQPILFESNMIVSILAYLGIAVRDTFKLISNESDKISSNINRFSTNFTGKISASLIARKFNRNTSSSKTSSSDVTKVRT